MGTLVDAVRSLRSGRSSSYRELFNRFLFLIGALVVFRFGTHVPVPGISTDALAELFRANQGTILSLFNMFSGGALERMSVFALGIMPYISASIVVQLLTSMVPQLESLKKEGEAGRRKINQYTRYGTLGLALVQAIGMSTGLINQGITLTSGMAFYVPAVTALVAGTMFLMWLGEQITERGLGNGISMIIFAGIVAALPQSITQAIVAVQQGQVNALVMLVVALLSVVVVSGVIYIEKAQRRIPINYAQRQDHGKKIYSVQHTHLPLKLNMAGVIPAIFASSLLMFPASIAQWYGQSANPSAIQKFVTDVGLLLSPGQPLYIVVFSALIIFFCFFYTALTFNPKEVSENLKKSGAYIPGIRPGEQTARYLDIVLTRLTFIGAMYITLICILPLVFQDLFKIHLNFGGTSLLIVVVVVMDFISQVQAHLTSHQYQSQSLLKSD